MDAEITRWINSFAGLSPLADSVTIWITQLGVPVVIGLVIVQWWSRTDRPHVRYAAISAGLSFMLGLSVNQAILLVVHRLRPYDAGVSHLLIAPSPDWAFPSDHATAAMSVAAAFVMARLPLRATVFLTMAVLVSLSRVFVGTHYVTDVLGGAATGICAAVVVHYAYLETSRLNRFATSIL
jgi:undecaprenyl-diphosphatase